MKKTWRIKSFIKNKTAGHAGFACLLTLLCVPVLPAKDLAAYHVGDAAEEDVITPVTLDVIDPAATAALKSAEALKTPAIFRSYADTNAVIKEFLTAFSGARSNFVATIQDTFHQAVPDEKTIASPDFGYLITAFNIKNKKFPVMADLAVDWARGNAGLAVQNKFLDALRQMMQQTARPDDLPPGFVIGKNLLLVPVNNPDEKLTISEAEHRGRLIPESNITTVSGLHMFFRREFTADDQPLARALALLLKPNCFPDGDLTQLARDRAVSQLVIAEHYEAGQVIVQRGIVIDPKIKAAFDQLREKSSSNPLDQPVVAGENIHALTQPAPASPVNQLVSPSSEIAPGISTSKAGGQNSALKISTPNAWRFAGLTAISAIVLLGLWRLFSQRRQTILLPARVADLLPSNPAGLQTELAPYLVQAVKEALVQELAVQRRELILAQQQAAVEIAGLVRRLDELQVPMQERLQAYELQIQRLEKELAERNEENRELLKLKIEMTRQQLEVERARNRAEFN